MTARGQAPWTWLENPPAHHVQHAKKHWRAVTVASSAVARAQEDPDFVAIVDGQRSMTRAQLLDEATRLATALQGRGLVAGDVVAFQLPNWHEAAVINLAAAISGMVVNPIVPIYRDAEVRQMLGDCRARAFFTCTQFRRFDFAAMTQRLMPELPALEFAFSVRGEGENDYARLLDEGEGAEFRSPAVNPFDVKMVLYTSGTTGRPKGVLHSHSTLEYVIRRSAEHWGIRAGDAILMPSPVTHISGYANGLEMPFVAGTCTVLMESWSADEAITLIENHGIVGAVAATPFLVELADQARATNKRLPTMTFFACGGAAVPSDLIPAANAAFENLRAFRVFGASEAPLVTYGWPDDEWLAATTDGEVVDYDIRIVNDEGDEIPFGSEGEILVKGPAMMLGYADKTQSEGSITSDGYFKTGDLGVLTSSHALTITGRKKDLIIRGGENISPAEIEHVLRTHVKVRDASVVAMPHERLGEGVCAFIISEAEPPSAQELVEHVVDSGLAKQKIPERWEFVDDFPRTASGKIRKDQLRAFVKEEIESRGTSE